MRSRYERIWENFTIYYNSVLQNDILICANGILSNFCTPAAISFSFFFTTEYLWSFLKLRIHCIRNAVCEVDFKCIMIIFLEGIFLPTADCETVHRLHIVKISIYQQYSSMWFWKWPVLQHGPRFMYHGQYCKTDGVMWTQPMDLSENPEFSFCSNFYAIYGVWVVLNGENWLITQSH